MARETEDQNFKPVIDAFQHWIDNCVFSDGSIFSSEKLWESKYIEEVRAAFVDHPDNSKDSFRTKLKRQVGNASPAAKHLMAEMLWVILIFPCNVSEETKREQIREIWALAGSDLHEAHPMLADEILAGVGSGGQAYNNFRWKELGFLIEIAGDLKKKTPAERQALFTDYDAFVSWIEQFPKGENRQFRHMLRYFVFPDRVERMSSNNDRQDILEAFDIAPKSDTRHWSDKQLDTALADLRKKMEAELPGKKLDFYDQPLAPKWRESEEPARVGDEPSQNARKNDQGIPTKNLILYGPPGTGKTYTTIERAVQIADPKFVGDHTAHKGRFDELRAKGQIEFITFHQSYSYEDFVEGLRPIVEEESNEAMYEYRPGVFKRLAITALFDCLKPEFGELSVSFETLWRKLVEQIEIEPDKKYPGLTDKTSYRLSLSAKGNLEGTNIISNKTFLCTRSILEKVFVAKPKGQSISSSEVMEIVVRGCHAHFVAAMFNELKRIEKAEFAGAKSKSVGIVSYDQKATVVLDYLQRQTPGAYDLKPSGQWPNYVLVIDEINRGNISKILGELITLIEPDKRVGADHSLVVTLPYTGDYFAVPGNLYILGTMNTADKSIALVDLALRRRFEFEEMRPNFDHCAKLSTQMRQMMETLNQRICLRKDRDHQIGHSYFKDVSNEDDFNRVFSKNIIPLLQEYFFNDWEGLRFVLGEHAKKDGIFIKPMAGSGIGEARTKWQWFFDLKIAGIDHLQALTDNYKSM